MVARPVVAAAATASHRASLAPAAASGCARRRSTLRGVQVGADGRKAGPLLRCAAGDGVADWGYAAGACSTERSGFWAGIDSATARLHSGAEQQPHSSWVVPACAERGTWQTRACNSRARPAAAGQAWHSAQTAVVMHAGGTACVDLYWGQHCCPPGLPENLHPSPDASPT